MKLWDDLLQQIQRMTDRERQQAIQDIEERNQRRMSLMNRFPSD